MSESARPVLIKLKLASNGPAKAGHYECRP
jgi:hypothetical protein